MDELDRRGELAVILALVTAKPCRGEGQHRTDALAAGLHQMRR